MITDAKALINQYRVVLGEWVSERQVTELDRRLIREIEVSSSKDSFWTDIIAITSWSQIVHPEVSSTVSAIQWDLVIAEVSGVASITLRSRFLVRLFKSPIAKRVLVISSPTEQGNIKALLGEHFDELERTRWQLQDIYPNAMPIALLRFEVVDYERSPEEIVCIQRYENIARRLANHGAFRQARLRLASSSIYAAEESLRRLRNQLVHSDAGELLQNPELDSRVSTDPRYDDALIELDKDKLASNQGELLEELTATLHAFGSVRVDAKFQALAKALQSAGHKDSGSHTWVYASYRATISYVASSLGELAERVYQLYGSLSPQEAQRSISEFRTDGGILVSSSALLEGADFTTDTLVLYDIPDSRNVIYQLVSRLILSRSASSGTRPTILVLHDTSSTIPMEERRFQKFTTVIRDFVADDL